MEMPILQLFETSCSLGNYCQPFFAVYLQAQLVPNGPPFSHNTFSREFFGWQGREYGRNRENYARLGKWLGEGHVECHFVGFPRARNYSRVLEMPGTSQNLKWAAATIATLAQKLARIVKNQWKPNISLFPLIFTRARGSSLDGSESNNKRTSEKKYARLGNV